MIGLGFVYPVAGLIFLAFAGSALRDRLQPRRIIRALFHLLVALSLFAGDLLGDIGNGGLVVALVSVAAIGWKARPSGGGQGALDRAKAAAVHGNRLFLPALLIPVTALLGTILFHRWPGWFDPRQITLVALTLGVLGALAAAIAWLRPPAWAAFDEGRRLMDAIGPVALLPQMLATLGALFALAGVGKVVGGLAAGIIPAGSLGGAVLAYVLGMTLLTMAMGNAFAAFPVMASAVGIPMLIGKAGGDPAAVAAMGMLAGFCGTLMTPMAANFNLVPAALLDLRDRHAVIRAQIPTAVPLFAVNALLLYGLAFQ